MNILCRSCFNHIHLDFRDNAITTTRMVKWLNLCILPCLSCILNPKVFDKLESG